MIKFLPTPLRSFLLLILLFFATACTKTQLKDDHPAHQAEGKPNILFILVDDLGWSDLGYSGSTFHETPNIDQLAFQGMHFTNAYAASPVCSPTRASIMTGKHPARLNLTDWIPGRQSKDNLARFFKIMPPDFEQQLPHDEMTIAEALKEVGYHAGFFGKWHLGKEGSWPEDHGFDINKGGWEKGAPYYRKYNKNTDTWHGESGFFSPYKNPRLDDGPEGEYLTDRLADETIKFIRQKREQPFFAFLSFYTVHNPLHGKQALVDKYVAKAKRLKLDKVSPFDEKKTRMNRPDPGIWKERTIQSNAEYAAMVESLDQNVGRVLDAIKNLGLDKNTVIIFTSDNGGLSTSEGSATTNYPLRAGKGWLYEGGIREPTIVKWPGVTPLNSVCDTPVNSADFYPTILSMAGSKPSSSQAIDGVDISPLLANPRETDDRAHFWHYPHYSNQGGMPGAAVRLGNFKLIEFFEDQRVELYDLAADLGETQDLSAVMPEKSNELLALLRAWQKGVGARLPRER